MSYIILIENCESLSMNICRVVGEKNISAMAVYKMMMEYAQTFKYIYISVYKQFDD